MEEQIEWKKDALFWSLGLVAIRIAEQKLEVLSIYGRGLLLLYGMKVRLWIVVEVLKTDRFKAIFELSSLFMATFLEEFFTFIQ